MKRKLFVVMLLILSVFIVGGCGSAATSNKTEQPASSASDQTKSSTIEKTQEEANAQLKAEAEKADFVKLNGHTAEYKGLKVFTEGSISVVDYDNVMDVFPSFTLTQVENGGYGMYHITNALSIPDLKDGDTVTIYGIVSGTDSTGAIKIIATIIEKN